MDAKKNNQQTNPLKSNFTRNILICTILLIVVLLVFWAVNSGARGEQTTYDDLVTKIESGSVKSIEIGNKYIIAQYNDGELYWIYNSNGVGSLILENFTEGNYDMSKVKVISGSTETFNVLNILYPILLVTVLIVVLRMVLKNIGLIQKIYRKFNDASMFQTANNSKL